MLPAKRFVQPFQIEYEAAEVDRHLIAMKNIVNDPFQQASAYRQKQRNRIVQKDYFLNRFSKARRASSTRPAPTEVSFSTRLLSANNVH